MSYYLLIPGGRIIGFISFARVLVICERQSVSSRIWTRVAVSISYDENHFTTCTSANQSLVESYQRLKNWYLMPPWLSTQHNKASIKGKVEQSREWGSAPSYTSVLWLLKRESSNHPQLRLPSLLYLLYIKRGNSWSMEALLAKPVSSSEVDLATWIQSLNEVDGISRCANTTEKHMNPIILHLSILTGRFNQLI